MLTTIDSSDTLLLAYFCTGIRDEAEFMAMRFGV